MDLYGIVKTLHIVSAAILFGTGIGIAFFFFSAHRGGDLASRYFAARATVLADFLFTLPAIVVQPVTGFWLIYRNGWDWSEAWLVATYLLYLVAGLCWLPVVWIQLRLRSMLRHAVAANAPLPDAYIRLFRLWFVLGWPAFFGLVAIFFLMVLRPTW
jgi:uncharacterized membrane protein